MSESSFMENLLDGAEVEWKPLGEVVLLEKGKQLNKELLLKEGLYPAFNGGISHSGFTNIYNYPEDTIIISQGGASAGFVNYIKTRFYANAHCYVVLPKLEIVVNRYVYHFLKQNQRALTEKQHGAGIPALNKNEILDILIPIPCSDNPKKSLEIQTEIVRILDAFAELTTELTTELTNRNKQYNHYRDQLLSFEEGEVEWKTLEELVATIRTGKLNANAMVEDGKYPFFTCDANPFKIDTYAFDAEAIIVSGNGSQVGHINYYKGKFNAYQRTYILADCADEITLGFLLAYLKAYLRAYIMQHSKKGSVPYITMPMLQNFEVPVPSLTEQARIVAILDKFDTLTQSISEGLPREIELRQKQYEHYRDLLLSFPKPGEGTTNGHE